MQGLQDPSSTMVSACVTAYLVTLGPQGGWTCTHKKHSGWIPPEAMEAVVADPIPYVRRVTGKLKGRSIDVELGPKTLIIGPNKAGKSSITDAVAIASGGAYPAVFGRALVATKQKLVVLGVDGRLPEAKVEVEGGSPRAVTLSHLWKVRDVLTSDPKKLRTWLIEQAEPEAEDLDAALKVAERRLRTARADLKAAKAAAKLGQAAATPPMPRERAKKLDDERIGLQTLLRPFAGLHSVEDVEQAVVDAEAVVEAVAKASRQMRKYEKAQAVILIAQTHLDRGLPSCLLCGGKTDENRLEQKIERMEQVKPPETTVSAEHAESQLESAQALAENTQSLRRHGGLFELRARLAAVKEQLSTDRERTRAWKKMQEAAQDNTVEAGAAVGEAEVLVDQIKERIAAEGPAAAAKVCLLANRYLPGDLSLVIDVEIGIVGFEETGEVRFGLSGSEYEQATMALAAATKPKGNDVDVFVPLDVGWDPETLLEQLEAWTDVEAQVLVATPTWPGRWVKDKFLREVPEGWTVVEVG